LILWVRHKDKLTLLYFIFLEIIHHPITSYSLIKHKILNLFLDDLNLFISSKY
jgi:hypothetical protein